jgi:polyisoprenoid-binding protein YceI
MVIRSRLARSLTWLVVFAAPAVRLEAQPETYEIESKESRVRIHLGRAGLMKFLGHDHHIEAPIAEGRVEVVDGDPARSSVALRFESARLAVVPGSEPADDIVKVEERMRGPEVLAVARYPEIVFASTSVRSQAADGSRFTIAVAGFLKVRGRAFPVEIPLEVVRDTLGIVARGALALNLRDLGIEPPSVAGVVKVSNRFRLEFEIRATPPAKSGRTRGGDRAGAAGSPDQRDPPSLPVRSNEVRGVSRHVRAVPPVRALRSPSGRATRMWSGSGRGSRTVLRPWSLGPLRGDRSSRHDRGKSPG